MTSPTAHPIDYLIIGHVVQDLLPDGSYTFGGTATYAARTALALGCRVGIVTSVAPDLLLKPVLSGCEVMRVPAERTTTFENIYTPQGRQQYLHAVASRLDLRAVPPRWRNPDIVHIAPLADECDPALVTAFPGALVGVTPQGWMRGWDGDGRVFFKGWPHLKEVLPHVDAAVLSQEDVAGDLALLSQMASRALILVVTLSERGCRVHVGRQARVIPVEPVKEVDPTGAGDIFAAVFFVRLQQLGDPWAAARFANRVGALSVLRSGWAATPTAEEISALVQAA
jgi:sugar/nucleoside kinase (ribokinase family)